MARVKVSYRLDEDVSKCLNNVAFLLTKKKNEIVNEALREYLDKLIRTEKLDDKIKSLED